MLNRRDLLNLSLRTLLTAYVKPLFALENPVHIPSRDELMDAYLAFFETFEKRQFAKNAKIRAFNATASDDNKQKENYFSYRAVNGTLSLEAVLDSPPDTLCVINLTTPTHEYSASILVGNLSFGDGYRFSIRDLDSKSGEKATWLLDDELNISRFGILGQKNYAGLLPINLFKQLAVTNSSFTDIYARSQMFDSHFNDFLKLLEKFN